MTATLRAQLKEFGSFATTVNAQLKDVNQLHSELDDDHKPLPIVKPRLDRAYDELERTAKEEIKCVLLSTQTVAREFTLDSLRMIDRAIETLDMLYKSQVAHDAATPSVAPPPPVAPAIVRAPLPRRPCLSSPSLILSSAIRSKQTRPLQEEAKGRRGLGGWLPSTLGCPFS